MKSLIIRCREILFGALAASLWAANAAAIPVNASQSVGFDYDFSGIPTGVHVDMNLHTTIADPFDGLSPDFTLEISEMSTIITSLSVQATAGSTTIVEDFVNLPKNVLSVLIEAGPGASFDLDTVNLTSGGIVLFGCCALQAVPVSSVPEPSTWTIMLLGLAVFSLMYDTGRLLRRLR
jgi:hypothetical protein